MYTNPEFLIEQSKNILTCYNIYSSCGIICNYTNNEDFQLAVQAYSNKINSIPISFFYMPGKIQAYLYGHLPFLFEQYKIREAFLQNFRSIETIIYLKDLIINSKLNMIELIKDINIGPKPYELNISKLLKDLIENNTFDFNDFKEYSWEGQFKAFFWSCKEKCYNYAIGWHPKNPLSYDSKGISDMYTIIKKKELAYSGYYENTYTTKTINAPTNYIFKSIGDCPDIDAKPKNFLVGLMYDDALNAANKSIVKSSRR